MLQVPLDIHALMQNAHDQDAALGFAVEYRVAGSLHSHIARADMARVTSNIWKLCQPLECLVQPQDILLGVDNSPPLQKVVSDNLDVGVSFT